MQNKKLYNAELKLTILTSRKLVLRQHIMRVKFVAQEIITSLCGIRYNENYLHLHNILRGKVTHSLQPPRCVSLHSRNFHRGRRYLNDMIEYLFE